MNKNGNVFNILYSYLTAQKLVKKICSSSFDNKPEIIYAFFLDDFTINL